MFLSVQGRFSSWMSRLRDFPAGKKNQSIMLENMHTIVYINVQIKKRGGGYYDHGNIYGISQKGVKTHFTSRARERVYYIATRQAGCGNIALQLIARPRAFMEEARFKTFGQRRQPFKSYSQRTSNILI